MNVVIKFINFSYLFIVLILTTILISCNENSNSPEEIKEITLSTLQFPEFFVEKGSDSDSTYISFKGIKINNDTLGIEATIWGVRESGLFLSRRNYHFGIQYNVMARCGTVSSYTLQKINLKEWITKSEADTLWSLRFTNYRDTLEVVKVTIH